MQYPNYRNRASAPVVKAYAEFLGQNERDDRGSIDSYPKSSLKPDKLSREVGRGCLLRTCRKAQTQAERMLRRVQVRVDTAKASGNLAGVQSSDGRKIRLIQKTAELLLSSDDPQRIRHEIHDEVVEQLRETGKQKLRMRDIQLSRLLAGERAELVALGLLTRLGSPWEMAMPALPHHDKDASNRNNYDVLLAARVSASEDAAVKFYRVQTKAGCLGLCNGDPERLQLYRDQYTPEIVLVSGHCDLAMAPPVGQPSYDRTANLLIKEHAETISTDNLDALDALSSSLIFSMTMQDSRRLGYAAITAQQIDTISA